MKKILLFSVLFLFLQGCSEQETEELTISEVENIPSQVSEFIDAVMMDEDGSGNGIYIAENKGNKYLFLSQEFLDEGKKFGEPRVESEDDTLNVYLFDTSSDNASQQTGGKLYYIETDKNYEFLEIFKNGEETYITAVTAIE